MTRLTAGGVVASAMFVLATLSTVTAQQRGAASDTGPARGQAPPAPAARTMPSIPTGKKYVALGCVSKAEATGSAKPGFIITDPRGGKPTVYKLDYDEAELTFQVGHWVEVSGTLSVPPAGTSGPNADALLMKVSALTYLSRTCPK